MPALVCRHPHTSDKCIAGAVVTAGEFTKATGYRLLRGGRVVWEGTEIDSLKRFKDDVNKVAKGVEFGIAIPFGQTKVGDKIVSYNVKRVFKKMEIKL